MRCFSDPPRGFPVWPFAQGAVFLDTAGALLRRRQHGPMGIPGHDRRCDDHPRALHRPAPRHGPRGARGAETRESLLEQSLACVVGEGVGPTGRHAPSRRCGGMCRPRREPGVFFTDGAPARWSRAPRTSTRLEADDPSHLLTVASRQASRRGDVTPWASLFYYNGSRSDWIWYPAENLPDPPMTRNRLGSRRERIPSSGLPPVEHLPPAEAQAQP